MTVDLLSSRLKAAKRELTALKTAHTRGFGLLKVYTKTLNYSQTGIAEGGIYTNATLTISFSRDFPPRPFVYVLGDIDVTAGTEIGRWPAFNARTFDYSSDGYTVVMGGTLIYLLSAATPLEKVKAFATSPIISISATV